METSELELGTRFFYVDKQRVIERQHLYIALIYDIDTKTGKIKKDTKIYYLGYWIVKPYEEIPGDIKMRFTEINIAYSCNFLPIMHITQQHNKQRSIMLVFGSGKSFIGMNIIRAYKAIQRRPVYYITSNDVSVDTSMDPTQFTVIRLERLLEHYSGDDSLNAFKTSNDFSDSLLVIDDLAFNSKREEKLFWRFFNTILMLRRKYGTNVLYITHHESEGIYTRVLYTEITHYIFFSGRGSGSLTNRSNIILCDYMKLTKQEIMKLTESAAKWQCVFNREKLVLSSNDAYFLK